MSSANRTPPLDSVTIIVRERTRNKRYRQHNTPKQEIGRLGNAVDLPAEIFKAVRQRDIDNCVSSNAESRRQLTNPGGVLAPLSCHRKVLRVWSHANGIEDDKHFEARVKLTTSQYHFIDDLSNVIDVRIHCDCRAS